LADVLEQRFLYPVHKSIHLHAVTYTWEATAARHPWELLATVGLANPALVLLGWELPSLRSTASEDGADPPARLLHLQ
jgi:hypothetical protein